MKRPQIVKFTAPVLIAVVIGTIVWVNAGSLTPPGGPVASTMKTLSEVEPRTAINAANTPGDATSLFKIVVPGSYYLTGNITGVVGKHGIEIAARGVTLDLNGFDLGGVAGSLDGVNGAFTVPPLLNIAVVNGSVRNWGGSGIVLVSPFNSRVADLRASDNAGDGIIVDKGSSVSNCTAFNNGVYGIDALNDCIVTNCVASSNTSNGIHANDGCTISNCTTSFNSHNGIEVLIGCAIVDCTSRANAHDGIRSVDGCMIRGNTCPLNGNGGDGAGVHTIGANNRIEGNHCTAADRGIFVEVAGNFIVRNTCADNTTANWVFAANNVYGPILDRIAPGSPPVNGNFAPDSTGSTHPNANFTY